MNPVVNFKSVRKLFKKDHPPFVILHHQKLIFITKEAGKVLDVSNPAWPLKQHTAQSGIKQNPLPVISSTGGRENLNVIRNTPSFCFPSCLLRHFLQLNQSEALSFTRWALRKLLPFAAKQRAAQPFTRSKAQLLALENEEMKSPIRQVLVVPGGIEARVEDRIFGLDDEQHVNKGGEPCPKL